jgi:hypothetical protein
MEEIKTLLLSVKKKAEAAALKIEVLENEKAELKAKVEILKADNEAKTQEIIKLQQAKDVLKIAKVVSSDDNNKGSKQKIAELVREIDNCIMLLK